jgi:hypothetical protein
LKGFDEEAITLEEDTGSELNNLSDSDWEGSHLEWEWTYIEMKRANIERERANMKIQVAQRGESHRDLLSRTSSLEGLPLTSSRNDAKDSARSSKTCYR